MERLVVENLVDWGKSFVDENGNFYCGATEEQKAIAAEVASDADLVIYNADVHTRGSSEFAINGGLYPIHNLVKKDRYDLDILGVEKDKSVSPQLTNKLHQIVKNKSSGLLVPRHVFFQDYDGKEIEPAFTYKDVEDTFGIEILDSKEFLNGDIGYVINAKHLFNGAALQSTEFLGDFDGIPSREYNVYTLLKQKYGQGKDLVMNITGVVTGICIYQTASGIKSLFKNAEVNIISDGTTQLLDDELGFGDPNEAEKAIIGMCKYLGINYITSEKYLAGRSK